METIVNLKICQMNQQHINRKQHNNDVPKFKLWEGERRSITA